MRLVLEIDLYKLGIFVGLTCLGTVISIILDRITDWKEIGWRMSAGIVSGIVCYFMLPDTPYASLILIGYSATDFLRRIVERLRSH